MKRKKQLIWALFQFEAGFRICLMLFVNPLLSQLVRLYLSQSTSGMAFNSDIWMRFLSLPGIFLALFLMLAGTGLILFEFAAVIHLLYDYRQGRPLSVSEATRQAVFSLSGLWNFQLPLATLYLAVLLPAVHLGYINALIPRLRVPGFVVHELTLTVYGQVLVSLFWIVLYGSGITLLFVPVLMVFRRLPFFKAVGENIRIWKRLSRSEISRVLTGCGLWFIAETLVIQLLPQALLVNSDFNRFFLKNILMSPTFRVYLTQFVMIQLLFLVMSLLFLNDIVKLLLSHQTVMIEEPAESKDAERLNEAVTLVRSAASAGVARLRTSEQIHRWLHTHPWICGIAGLVLFLSIMPVLFPDFISVLLPIILITAFLYGLGALLTRFQHGKESWLTLPYQKLHDWLKDRKFYRRHPWIVRLCLVFIVLYSADLYLRPLSREHQPWAVGHRGSAYAVENTIESVRQAALAGADYAEIDIQLSADGVPMVFHDATLSRLAGSSKAVGDLTAAELQALTLRAGGRTDTIPTLEQLIQAMKGWKEQTGLMIELKPADGNQQQMAQKLVEVIEREDFVSRAIYMSIDYEAVQAMQRLRPDWWIGYCVYGTVGEMDARIWNWNIDFLAVEESQISLSFLEQAGRSWMPVYVWTVDDYEKMKNYLDMGVSGLITNYPDLAREEIDDYMQRSPQYYQFSGPGYPNYSSLWADGDDGNPE